MKYLLDTNTCIAAMRHHPLVLARMAVVAPGDCGISSITAFELFTGLEKCGNPALERPRLERLWQVVLELQFQSTAAQEAAKIRASLEAQGRAIGPYDVLIAGHTMALKLILVTNNTKEFSRVAGLPIENWQI